MGICDGEMTCGVDKSPYYISESCPPDITSSSYVAVFFIPAQPLKEVER